MDPDSQYSEQAQMLVRTLPVLAGFPAFALKGGTAINLFIRDVPRLSVDIDLTWIPASERDADLKSINATMRAIATALEQRTGYRVHQSRLAETGTITRLLVDNGRSRIKIEVSPVLRGSLLPPTVRRISPVAEQRFGFAEMLLLDFREVYAGKMCAALDRQHPRDLFDIMLLLENEGIDDDLLGVFLVYLLSHHRPIAELLAPNRKSLDELFRREFSGMTTRPVTVRELDAVREQLIGIIHAGITSRDRSFLLGIKQGHPDWSLFRFPQAAQLPAVRWKLYNLSRMDPTVRQHAAEKLARALDTT